MTLQPGQRVQVPFGRGNVTAEGIVITVGTGPEEKLKAVESCLDEEPLLSETQLRLAAFLRERYFCTFYDGARAMLPAGLWFRQRETFTLTADRSWETASIRKEGAREMLEAIRDQGGACRDCGPDGAPAKDPGQDGKNRVSGSLCRGGYGLCHEPPKGSRHAAQRFAAAVQRGRCQC